VRILSIDPAPLLILPYLNAARRGGTELGHLRCERVVVMVPPP
jgi:hypothetical protein